MGKYFGTDGFRGEANVDLTVEHAYKVGRFLGWYYGKDHKAQIVIGKDTRRSSYMFEYSLVAGLTASGADVYLPYDCTLQPGEIAKIPLGFGLEIPDGYAGYIFPRTSMAVKGLVCELPPVDSGYRGEIHAIISNVSNQAQSLFKGARIGQLVITPIVIADFVTDLGTERGTGSFGSTGE